jgi:superfamily II DNA or RNA helicase
MPHTSKVKKGIIDLQTRYEGFQSDAVESILSDYSDNLAVRVLLVIPTGGGKTFTAVRAIHNLFRASILDPVHDDVLWTAHRTHLVTQAKDTFDQYAEQQAGPSYQERVHFSMISGAATFLRDNRSVKMVVIDEAHHAAITNTQYGPLLTQPNLGVLGLTATPARHDGLGLEFSHESYSIGFRDLVDRQVILMPTIRFVQDGSSYVGVSLKGSALSGLEELETDERDFKILRHLAENTDDYTKIIIFAASVAHTKSLYRKLQKWDCADKYESIDYVTGSDNSLSVSRDDFISIIKSHTRSIVVNHDVLSEGYDDPKVNTIVMARPTRSKLVYMQSIGRGIRINPNQPDKRAYVVEIEEDLPNVRYLINNRMLFSDIDDTLEPEVLDKQFSSQDQFTTCLKQIYDELSVRKEFRKIPLWEKRIRYSLLLFRSFVGGGQYEHIPILIDNLNRGKVQNWFNFLSQGMKKYSSYNPLRAMELSNYQGIEPLQGETTKLVYWAMQNAWKETQKPANKSNPDLSWIKFVALRFKEETLSKQLLDFVSGMVNRDQIEDQIKTKSYVVGAHLVRLPLPLRGSIGFILPNTEFGRIEEIVNFLYRIREDSQVSEHGHEVSNLLNRSTLPVDMIYREALPTIVREDAEYHIVLE